MKKYRYVVALSSRQWSFGEKVAEHDETIAQHDATIDVMYW
jgi:hypothetical protein